MTALAKKAKDAIHEAIRRTVDQWILALTIFFEARGEPAAGQAAVASVILNRLKHPTKRFGPTLMHVCLAPKQFSCFNDLQLSSALMKLYAEPIAFHDALGTAALALSGDFGDCTGGADHYHSIHIEPPSWADPLKRTVTIENHVFLKLG